MTHMMVATKNFRYAKRALKVGDIFKCKDKHAQVLELGKLARRDMPAIVTKPLVYATRHLESARTVIELRAEAEAKGIMLSKGYIPKAELLRLVEGS